MRKNNIPASVKETARPTTKQYSFFEDVYAVVRQIPKGRVTSYGAIAKYLGTKLSATNGGLGYECSACSYTKSTGSPRSK